MQGRARVVGVVLLIFVLRLNLRYPPPPRPAFFFNARFMAARREEGRHAKKNLYTWYISSFAKEALSNDDVGVARATVLQ